MLLQGFAKHLTLLATLGGLRTALQKWLPQGVEPNPKKLPQEAEPNKLPQFLLCKRIVWQQC